MNTSQSPNDNALMFMLQDGDQSAFETLLNRHKRYVLNIIFKYLHDADQAEDLAQEVFTRVYLKRDSFKPVAKFTTWLYAITANLCLNHIRDEKKHQHTSLQSIGTESRPFEPADSTSIIPLHQVNSQELRDMVWAAVQDLPPQQRMAIILYRFENMNYSEIAETLNVTIPALKSLIFRGRSSLAERLSHYIKRQ